LSPFFFQAPPKIVTTLVGNKFDLKYKRTVSTETAEAFATLNGLTFTETSAKTGFNCDEVLQTLGKNLSSNLIEVHFSIFHSHRITMH
jgi:hypothetical protein